jgi:hypothetical protein
MSTSHRQGSPAVPRGHRTAELRSIAFHRLVAEQLDDEQIQRARKRVGGWLATDGPVDHRWARRWEELLDLPIGEFKERLIEDSEQMRDLRQSTPFAGVVNDEERKKILLKVR